MITCSGHEWHWTVHSQYRIGEKPISWHTCLALSICHCFLIMHMQKLVQFLKSLTLYRMSTIELIQTLYKMVTGRTVPDFMPLKFNRIIFNNGSTALVIVFSKKSLWWETTNIMKGENRRRRREWSWRNTYEINYKTAVRITPGRCPKKCLSIGVRGLSKCCGQTPSVWVWVSKVEYGRKRTWF